MVRTKKKRGPDRLAKSLTGCAVEVLRQHPHEQDIGELVELTKYLAARRGIRWDYGHRITDALHRALRYDPREGLL